MLISISRSSQPCARSQPRSCAVGSSSIHQKSEFGSIASHLWAVQGADSINSRIAHLGSASTAPAARKARRMPSGQPVRARLVNQKHRNRAVAHSRNSEQPGPSSNASKIHEFRRRSSTRSTSTNNIGGTSGQMGSQAPPLCYLRHCPALS